MWPSSRCSPRSGSRRSTPANAPAWRASGRPGSSDLAAASGDRIVPLGCGPAAGRVRRSVGRRRRARRHECAPRRRSSSYEARDSCSSTRWPARGPLPHPTGGSRSPTTRARCNAPTSRGSRTGRSEWPDVTVVFAILAGGAPIQLERLASRGVDVRSVLHPNVFFDTASYGRRALELCVETFGVENIVHGSDAPVIDPEPTLRAIRDFGESVEKLIMCANPGRLLS